MFGLDDKCLTTQFLAIERPTSPHSASQQQLPGFAWSGQNTDGSVADAVTIDTEQHHRETVRVGNGNSWISRFRPMERRQQVPPPCLVGRTQARIVSTDNFYLYIDFLLNPLSYFRSQRQLPVRAETQFSATWRVCMFTFCLYWLFSSVSPKHAIQIEGNSASCVRRD